MRRRLLLGAVLVAAACHRQAPDDEGSVPPVAVHCVTAQIEPVDERLEVRGHVEPPPGGSSAICAQVPGRVASVAVREGDHVGPGDLIATISDATAGDAAHQADAALAQARANLENAESTLDRTRAVVERGVNATQDLDDALARQRAARASLDAARAQSDLAHHTLGRTQVRSAVDGVVTRVWRGPGALVDGTPATPIVDVTASGAAEFVVEATGLELPKIESGARVQGELVSGVTFEGSVRSRPQAIDASSGLGIVRVAISEPKSGLVPGTFGRARITGAHRTASVLPIAALRGAVSDGAEVAVCKDDHVELVRVSVGYRDEKRFELVDSTLGNARVAVDHVLGLDDGTKIRVLE